jgi:urease accessory protein
VLVVDNMLLILADGRFPSGGHAYSAGVESAVRRGDVYDEPSLERYLRARLATTGVTDAAFAARTAAAHSSVTGSTVIGDREFALLACLDAEFTARVVSPRQRLVSRQLGRQLARGASAVWPSPLLSALAAVPGGPHQPIVVGATVAGAGGTPSDAATIALHHLAAAVSTAAIRLLGLDPIGVTAVQSRCASLARELVRDVDVWATAAPADLPARSGALTEILAEDHGQWDARLFVA